MSLEAERTYVSEAGHWYRPDGTPCHEVPYKTKEGMKPCTLREAREMGLYPSVSGVLKIMDQPGLRRWRDRQIAEAAWRVAIIPPNDEEESYIGSVLDLAQDRMSVCRDRGSEVHGQIERWLKNDGELFTIWVEAATNALNFLECWPSEYRAERSFSSPLGYGGCSDYVTEEIVVDFKCVTRLEKKLDYWDRCAQIAAYNMGIFGELRRGANIYIDSETAEFKIREWTQEELQYGWSMFQACFALWKIVNRFDPLNVNPAPLSRVV